MVEIIKNSKILMITSSAGIGGGPSHIFTLSEIISDEFEIYYASPKINKSLFSEKKYIKISERKVNLIDIIKLIRFIRINSIKIIHCHGKGAGVIGRFLKLFLNVKLIYTFHGIHLQCHNFFNRYFYLIYENILGRMDDFKIFVSEGEFNYAKKNKIFIGRNFSVINNAVKHKNFRNNKFYSKDFNYLPRIKTHGDNVIKIISVCRLVDQKNIFEILMIAKFLKNIQFNIIGGGYLFEKAKKFLIEENIKNVFLLNSKLNIYKYLYEADTFLSTSLYEGLPISLLEAMSIGLPIVASNVVGNYDVVKDGETGFLYELGNIDMAADCIKKIVNNKNINYMFSQNSQKLQREKFSIKVMRRKYLSLYKTF